jgi:hypothetical protein
METLEPVFEAAGIEKLEFQTKPDGVIAGRKHSEMGGVTFQLWASLYADDAGLPFTTRADLELGARLLKKHLSVALRSGDAMRHYEPVRRFRRQEVQD